MRLKIQLILACFSAAVSAVFTIRGIIKHFRLTKKKNDSKKFVKHTPSELRDFCSKNITENPSLFQKYNDFERVLPKVLIQGKSKRYENQKNDEYFYYQKKTKLLFYNSKPKLKEITTKTLPFKIVDLKMEKNNENNEIFISIFQNDNVKCKIIPEILQEFRQENKLNISENIALFFSALTSQLLTKLSFNYPFKKIFLGINKEEVVVKFGNNICVYGDLIYNYKENTMRIDHPLKFFSSASQMISAINDKISKNMKQTFFFIGLGCISLGFLYDLKIRSQTPKKHKQENLELVKHVTMRGKDFRCEICHFRQKNIIFLPCSHLVLCKVCLEDNKENTKNCLYCNTKYTKYTEILIP